VKTMADPGRHHPVFARLYLRMASGRKAHGEDEYRCKLLEAFPDG
jgi:hypothetical protein